MHKGSRGIALWCGGLLLVTASLEAEAASARVRCQIVSGPRVRILVDGQDLARGVYTARVRNLETGKVASTEEGKEAVATRADPDVDLDFDSTADPSDSDSFIKANFAMPGDQVRARILNEDNLVVARAVATCERR
jgi:hypothetical protein